MRTEPSIYEAMNMDLSQVEPLRRFGKTQRPVPATVTYRRVISTLLRNGIRVEKWILINERDNSVTFATTYNGITCAHYDAAANTEWLSWEALRPRLEEFQFIPADECPIAHPISRQAVLPGSNRKIA